MKTATLRVHTPEGIVFSQLLAGPVTRFLAWSLDLLCIIAMLTALGILFGLLQMLSANIASALYILSYFIISVGYGIACEWAWRGQTVGKRLFRLRVVDAEGLKLQFHQIATRNLLRFVDSLPIFYFLGGIVCWFSSRCQRLGDIAANTIVIRHPRIAQPDLDQLLAGKFNSLRLYPHLAARLRQRVSPAEAAVAAQALVRREQFDPIPRLDLFANLASHFREKVEFPAEASDGIADEQYIRNVVDVLYRTKS
ncbi:MAG: RDD family protein [Verrucomicrobia bacterium]|nr:MAG: RDD family protein [Verrucomicrobiota bacterium]